MTKEGGKTADMLTIEIENKYLQRYERIMLELLEDDCLLPLTMVDCSDTTKMIYRTDGFISIAQYDFHDDLYRMFSAVRGYVHCIDRARDMLLRTELISYDGDTIFIRPSDGVVRAICRHDESGKNIDVSKMVISLLGTLANKANVTGAKPAMTRLARKIRATNPGLDDIVKLVDASERQWNYLRPVGM